jgi:hypothetical protein
VNTVTQKVILLGASNLYHCADHLRRAGRVVLDLSSPGWLASTDNIALLFGKLEKIQCGTDDTLILDLYGNPAYRFEQFDGLISLPYKSKGRYHFAGNIVTCPLSSLKKSAGEYNLCFPREKGLKVHCDSIPPEVSVFWLLFPIWSQW